MNRLNTLAAVGIAVLIFTSSSSAFAEMANGSYDHDFSGEVPLWDISGDYTEDIPGFGTDTYTIVEDTSGALTGTGNFNFDDGTVVLNGPFTLNGKVKGSGTVTRVSWKIFITGTGTVSGYAVTFTATGLENLELDSANRQLVLTGGRIHVTARDPATGRKKSGSFKIASGGGTDLPTDSTGDWTLNLMLNPVPDKTKYTGTATVETSTGGTGDLTAIGSYASKTDTSKITLKGMKGTGASLNLLISTVGSNMTVFSAKGKLYGQKVKFNAPSP